MPQAHQGAEPMAAAGQEHEPRLRYGPLGSESPRESAKPQHAASPATRLCVSDKVLAVGHRDGSVQLLDHLGNQARAGVKVFREHSREVTDLCFDEGAECLASCAADGTIAVAGLYTDDVQRLRAAHPVTAVALDPRYSGRKTRELVYGTASGTLVLSSKGWLGAKETILYTGKGAVHCARMAGTLLAWATDTGVRVYDTSTHTRLGKLERPASAAADPAAPCSMLWRGGRELLVCWGRQVTVVRVLGSLLPSAPGTHAGAVAAKRSLQVMASFDAGCTALGAAPFGADLAVLCWGEPSGGTAIEGAASAGMLLNDSTTADELPVSSPAGGTAPSDAASTLASSSGGGGTAEGGQPGGAAPSQDASPAQQQPAEQQQEEQQQQGAPPAQQEQQLALCFYTRSGQLLAADALPVSAPAAERRWHQLAVLYPGDADLRLAAAAAGGAGARPAPPTPSSTAGTPAGSVRTSRDGSPAKPAGGSPAPSSPRADGGEEQLAADSNGQQQAQQQQSVQRYQWWRDGEEPLYLISGPQGIIAGRPRDGNDRVAWLAERGRYADALAVAEEDASVQAPVREALGERFLQALAQEGRYAETAELCPRVLKGNELAWERWAYTFAQARQLGALAPTLPTDAPRLKPSTYDMVLAALLLNPAEHGVLLDCVRRWPQGAYDAVQLQAAVLERMGGAAPGAWPALQQVAAHLFTVQGRHEEALWLQLQLKSPAVFDYIARHALADRLAPYAAGAPRLLRCAAHLIELDEVKATALLVEECEAVAPAAVVAALQERASAAGADGEACAAWRRRLHHYLDWLFQRDSQLAGPFAELQVELYAEQEPARLLAFLMRSSSYHLDRAYQVCEAAGLVRETVYVLGRMGSADKALRLIVEGLRDVAQAVEFVQLQRDDGLWEPLIALALGDAQLTGALLDHAGGYIDPLRVVSQIPEGLRVDNLRGRLVRIIQDFRTQMCLQQGCNTILRHDCIVLANRLYRVLRSSLRRLHLKLHQGGAAKWVLYDARSGEETPEDAAVAAALLGEPAPAASGDRGAASAADGSSRGSGGSSTAQPQAGAAGSSSSTPRGGSPQAGPPQQQTPEAQQQARVWVGLLGSPAPAAATRPQTPPPEHPVRSPSKFVRLASGTSPAGRSGAGPRKVLVV